MYTRLDRGLLEIFGPTFFFSFLKQMKTKKYFFTLFF